MHRIPAHELVERMNHGLSLKTHGLPCDAQCEQLSKALCGWAVKGFPCTKGRLEQQLVKHMYGVVMEFLLPQLNFRERVARRTTGGLLYMRRVGQTRVNNPQLSSQEQKKASRIVSRRS